MNLARLQLTLGAAFIVLLTGCQTTPGPVTLPNLGLDRIPVGRNLADEPCWAESVTMAHESLALEPRAVRAYNIYCGDWEWPSARVFQVPQGTSELEHWSVDPAWRAFLERRMTCPDLAGASTTILEGAAARLLSCTLHNGGWPYAALVSFVNGYDYLADGIEAAVPAIECTIAFTAGIAAQACASPSAAVALMQESLRDHMHGAKDLQAYYDAMALGQHYNSVKAFAKGERQYREALAVQERVLGADNADSSDALMHLALELSNQEQFDSADQLFRNAYDKIDGGIVQEQQARLESYQALHAANQTKFEQARSAAQRATQLRHEQRGALEIPARVDTQGTSLVTGSVAYPVEAAQSLYIEAAMDARLGAMAQADRTLEQAERLIATSAEAPPLWEPHLLTLEGIIDESLGRAPQAEDAWTRAAREFAQRAPGGRPGDLALLDLARAKVAQGRSDEALTLYRTALRQARARNDGFSIAQLEPYFTLMLAQADAGAGERQTRNREMFAAAQLVRGGVTATDIARTTLRFAHDDTTTGEVLRRFQQADRARARAQQAYQAELGRVLEPSHPERRAALRAELERIDRDLRGLEEQLQAFQPGYKQILGFAIDADEVLEVLRPGEALVQVLAGRESTLVLLLRDGQITAYQAPVGSGEIVGQVNALRSVLGGRGVVVEGVTAAAASPARLAAQDAHALYARLFDPIATDLEAVSHLIVAASGPLLSFPFGLFVTAAPAVDGSAPIAWLARRTTISVVPSAQSFAYLRALQPARATKSLVAFADFLPGAQPDAAEAGIVSVSAYCAARQRTQHAQLSLLPNTGLEVQAVARNFAADTVDLHLAGDFTERAFGTLPLRDYAVIYLATHGARAGEIACITEPALVTSAPAGGETALNGSVEDGYLSSGEVAALELNADLVVLSSCNSGDAGATGGESLSGLARAFFFAGARALLVSHWYVDDPATYELMARMFETLQREPGTSLASALRTAQLWMMDEAPQRQLWNEPYYWAAFTLVGDGARSLGGA